MSVRWWEGFKAQAGIALSLQIWWSFQPLMKPMQSVPFAHVDKETRILPNCPIFPEKKESII